MPTKTTSAIALRDFADGVRYALAEGEAKGRGDADPGHRDIGGVLECEPAT